MIAGGEHVHSAVEQLEGDLGGDAGAVGGVLAVGDHEVHGACFAEVGQPAQQRVPARLAEHVADEEDVHLPAASPRGCGPSWPLPPGPLARVTEYTGMSRPTGLRRTSTLSHVREVLLWLGPTLKEIRRALES